MNSLAIPIRKDNQESFLRRHYLFLECFLLHMGLFNASDDIREGVSLLGGSSLALTSLFGGPNNQHGILNLEE